MNDALFADMEMTAEVRETAPWSSISALCGSGRVRKAAAVIDGQAILWSDEPVQAGFLETNQEGEDQS